jgi:hypothetical protein
MAVATSFDHPNFLMATLRRYGMSLGHGAMVLVVTTLAFVMGPWRSYGHLIWGLLTAEACLLGFWAALADRRLSTGVAYSALHLFGLVYCVLLAGAMHLDPLRAQYDVIDVLRDVAPMYLTSFISGLFLRRGAWRLRESNRENMAIDATPSRTYQITLCELIKWFTYLCIALGLAASLSSLLPSTSVLLDEWVWRSRFAYYVEFLLGVCVPAAVLSTLVHWLTLAWCEVRLRTAATVFAIWALVACIWIGIVISTPYVLAVYYSWRYAHLPSVDIPTPPPDLAVVTYGLDFPFGWSVLAFVFWLFVASASAYLSGWRLMRESRAVRAVT